jgi:signal transduction histidine kinase
MSQTSLHPSLAQSPFQLYDAAVREVRLTRLIALLIPLLFTPVAVVATILVLTGSQHVEAILPIRTRLVFVWVIWLFFWVGAIIFLLLAQSLIQRIAGMRLHYARAQQVDDLKDQFIASVNHEVRNPVMAMMGYLDIIDLSLEQNKTDRLHEHVRSAIRAGYALRDLINSILDTRRQDQGAYDYLPTTVSVRESLDTALGLLEPRERSRLEPVLRIAIPGDLMLWGDAVRLQQILSNLLSNAAKYTPPGTVVEVRASAVQTAPPGRFRRHQMPQEIVEIVVRDYGLGIPPEQIPLLFNRFVRLPRDLASRVIGNGLGLYLCKVLTEAMGGTIWVESTGIVGQGAAFFIHLPAAKDEVPAQVMAAVPVGQES